MTATSRPIVRDTSAAAPETAPRRILAVDYGRKRIGLALSDELQITAQPFLTLERVNRRDDLQRLREICREQGVSAYPRGPPLALDRRSG